MMWLADVLIGTKRQGWDERYARSNAVDEESTHRYRMRISGAVKQAWTYLLDGYQRRRAIHHVNQLNDHLLNDIGITRDQIPEFVRNGGLARSTDTTLSQKECVRTGYCYLVASGELTDQRCVGGSEDGVCPTDALQRAA